MIPLNESFSNGLCHLPINEIIQMKALIVILARHADLHKQKVLKIFSLLMKSPVKTAREF